ncbi:MAG TPA: hypothetical protein DHV62_05285 [Elusimicrobia bacterium]|jgi:serine protease Do|nr:hypothetical protein [Elusimicrobiota bacterium]
MFKQEKGSARNWFLILILLFALFFWWGKKQGKIVLFSRSKMETAPITTVAEVVPPAEVINLQEAFAQIAAVAKPAVVNISTVQLIEEKHPPVEFYFGDPFEEFFEEFFGMPRQEQQRRQQRTPKKLQRRLEGTGSGVIIDPEGYILTNEHVVRGATEIQVTISGENGKYTGKIVGKDERTDLAVVKIKPKNKLSAVKLGDSEKIRVGDWAVAIGSPFGLEQTVTVGIISALRQRLMIEGREYRDLIQTDAAINRGNSGGPLVNIHGEVIGINTAIYAPTGVFAGIGFAIPINQAKEILDDLIHKGKVVRGWLGVEIKEIDDAIQKQFGLPDEEGALVNNVLKDSPAEKAGLMRGDVIVKFDEKKVFTSYELQKIVGQTPPNKKVKIEIIRDKNRKTIELVTGEMPTKIEEAAAVAPEEVKGEWLGMKVSNFNSELGEKYGLPKEEKGVVIIAVEPGSKAEEIGLEEGDLIKSINRKQVAEVKDFNEITKKVKLSEGIVFDLNRRGKLLYLSYLGTE